MKIRMRRRKHKPSGMTLAGTAANADLLKRWKALEDAIYAANVKLHSNVSTLAEAFALEDLREKLKGAISQARDAQRVLEAQMETL